MTAQYSMYFSALWELNLNIAGSFLTIDAKCAVITGKSQHLLTVFRL
jgi:hypothetical protein